MATRPRFAERRRARRGSLERPINGRMYRGTWLLVGIPLLIAAFSVTRPQPLRPPALPPAFEAADATADAQEFARDFPDRSPEGANAQGAAAWVADRLGGLGLQTQTDRFHVEIPGRGGVDLQNVIARRFQAEMPDSSTILLVDDEDSVQSLLTYPLERDGFRVVSARDGEEALRLFAAEAIDLVAVSYTHLTLPTTPYV